PISQSTAVSRADALATASTAGLVLGAAGLVTGTILVFWYRPDEGPRPTARALPPPIPAWSAGVRPPGLELAGGVLRVARSRPRSGVVRAGAAALAACLLAAACNAFLGPHDLVYAACVADVDCPPGQACSAGLTCALANAEKCEDGVDGGGCASGFCSTDG